MGHFLHGVILGFEPSDGTTPITYAWAAQHWKRLIYLWLTKVVGWTVVDSTGTNWDNPIIPARTDGSTTSDRKTFASNTGGFTGTVLKNDCLFLTSGVDIGYAGVYRILQVVDDHTLIVDYKCGPHKWGLPTGGAAIHYEIHRFQSNTHLLSPNDFFVLGGVASWGTFHLLCRAPASSGSKYAPDYWQLSPYSDWDSVAHDWKKPERVTTICNFGQYSDVDMALVWAYAEADHAFFAISGRAYNIGAGGANRGTVVLYFGAIVPFYPASDPRPAIIMGGVVPYNEDVFWGYGNPAYMHGPSEYERCIGCAITSGSSWPQYSDRDWDRRSDYHYVGEAIRIGSSTACCGEVRGCCKNLFVTSYLPLFSNWSYTGPRAMTRYPYLDAILGSAAKDRLAIVAECCIPWNGSDQNRWYWDTGRDEINRIVADNVSVTDLMISPRLGYLRTVTVGDTIYSFQVTDKATGYATNGLPIRTISDTVAITDFWSKPLSLVVINEPGLAVVEWVTNHRPVPNDVVAVTDSTVAVKS